MQILLDKGIIHEMIDILDYGCGYGEDVEILRADYNFSIKGYDKYNKRFNDLNKLCYKYDVVTCNYVFNVIPNLEEHFILQKKLKELSDNVYITVRSDIKAIKYTWRYDANYIGYWTTQGTFQRFYNEYLIKKLFGDVEYIRNNQSMKLFKLL